MPETRFGLSSKNFDLYFAKEAENISEGQRENLPKDVLVRLWKRGTGLNKQAAWRVSFLAKIFILWRCLKKQVYIVVEDENGMSPEEFADYSKSLRKKNYGVKKAEEYVSEGHFILGNKELCDTFNYLNHMHHSPAYNFVLKDKQKIVNKVDKFQKQSEELVKFLLHYEHNKKRIINEFQIGIPEWYVLGYLYHSGEIVGSHLYKDYFFRAFQSSPRKIKVAFGTLQEKKLIEKLGERNGSTLRITALGRDMVNRIVARYVVQ